MWEFHHLKDKVFGIMSFNSLQEQFHLQFLSDSGVNCRNIQDAFDGQVFMFSGSF